MELFKFFMKLVKEKILCVSPKRIMQREAKEYKTVVRQYHEMNYEELMAKRKQLDEEYTKYGKLLLLELLMIFMSIGLLLWTVLWYEDYFLKKTFLFIAVLQLCAILPLFIFYFLIGYYKFKLTIRKANSIDEIIERSVIEKESIESIV